MPEAPFRKKTGARHVPHILRTSLVIGIRKEQRTGSKAMSQSIKHELWLTDEEKKDDEEHDED